ncbi:MAG TPA: DUF3857 domain-containing protein [Vicinamibacterales bacterium]|nr:DUF3857 domain-containing protein [Vicinamibacterales bacterium]
MTFRAAAFLIALSLANGVTSARAADPPDWLRAAASAPVDSTARSGAVVLLDDVDLTVAADGRMITRHRYVVRVMNADGRAAAATHVIYNAQTGKVTSMRGWILPAAKPASELPKARLLDAALAANDVYDEARVKFFDAGDDVEPGSVFGAETELTDRSVFTQFDWMLQERWPAVSVRRAVTVPDGWTVRSATFNAAAIDPTVAGRTYEWRARNLPEIVQEPAMPPMTAVSPRLAVSVLPPAGTGLPAFDSWASVSSWLASLADPRGVPDVTVAGRARALAEGRGTPWEKIAAIGEFVQHVQYISIQTGIGRGGGYQPHWPADVLAKNYGDCKDKANLMHAMLQAVGIPSHLLAIYAGDPDFVREAWPSPQQFNHAILAVGLDEPVDRPAVVRDPRYGWLLLADPTDDQTPIGELPGADQGGLALVVAERDGGFVRVPAEPADHNRHAITFDGQLSPEGQWTTSTTDRWSGRSAARERAWFVSLGVDRYRQRAEAALGRFGGGAATSNVATTGDGAVFTRTANVTASHYGRVVQTSLLLFTPPTIVVDDLSSVGTARQWPLRLTPQLITQTIRLSIPDGFAVDELPAGSTFEHAVGQFSLRTSTEGNRVVVEERLLLVGGAVPPDQVPGLRAFVEQVRASLAQPIVFKRVR